MIGSLELKYPVMRFSAQVEHFLGTRREVAPGGFENVSATARTELSIFVASVDEIALKKRYDKHLMVKRSFIEELGIGLFTIAALAFGIRVWRAADRAVATGSGRG